MKLLIPTLLVTLSPALASAEGTTARFTIAGSSTIEPVIQKASNAFARRNGGIQFDITTGGSHYGVFACGNGEAVLGMVSRELRDKEMDKYPNLHSTTVGYDGVVFLVGANNPVKNLSKSQIRDIYTGKIHNWNQVGGHDAAIQPYYQTMNHGTAAVASKKVGLACLVNDEGYVDIRPRGESGFKPYRVQAFDGHDAVFTAMRSNPNAIGFASYGYAKQEIERTKNQQFKMISFDSVQPNEKNIAENVYGIYRPLNLVTQGNPQGHVQKFIDFMESNEGHGYLEDAGFVPAN